MQDQQKVLLWLSTETGTNQIISRAVVVFPQYQRFVDYCSPTLITSNLMVLLFEYF